MSLRIVTMLGLVIGLVGLSFYTAHNHPWIDTTECLQHSEQFDGCLVIRFREPMIGEIYNDGFQLIQKNQPPIRVYSDTTELRSGEFIGLQAIYHKEGYLTAEDLRVARNRRYKIWISMIPVLILGVGILCLFRFDSRRFQIELRNHA